MLRLYDYLPSQNAWKVRLLLNHLGLKYERVPVSIFEGESHTDAYLEKNPAGAVPVLEIEPGQYVAESNAILCYLAEGTRYMPTDRLERARVMQWLFFEQSYVEPQIGSLRYWTLTDKLGKRSADMIAGKRAYSLRALAALERYLASRKFLVGTATASPTWPSTPMPLMRTRRGSTSRPIPPSERGLRGSKRSLISSESALRIRSMPTRAGSSAEAAFHRSGPPLW